MTDGPTKDHILESAIAAVEKHGLPGLTTRQIAAEAGVNNAALHYYFGTKDALLEAALALTLDHMLTDTKEILNRPQPIEARLRALLDYLLVGTLAFPNIIRAHLWSPLMGGAGESPFERMQEDWVDRVWREVRRERPGASESAVRLALRTTLGGVVFLALMPPGIGPRPLTLRRSAVRDRYVDQLVDFVLAGPRRSSPRRRSRPVSSHRGEG